jgi:hypothetical protein
MLAMYAFEGNLAKMEKTGKNLTYLILDNRNLQDSMTSKNTLFPNKAFLLNTKFP